MGLSDSCSFLYFQKSFSFRLHKVRRAPVTDSAFIRLTARGVYSVLHVPRGHACRQSGHGRSLGRPHALARGWFLAVPCCLRRCPPIVCEVIMSELDPVTFLIATELLAASDTTSSHRRTALVSSPTISSPTLILVAEGGENESGSSDSFEDLSIRAQRDFGADSVRIAYLHSDSPSLSEVVEDLLSARIHCRFAFCRCFFRKPNRPLENRFRDSRPSGKIRRARNRTASRYRRGRSLPAATLANGSRARTPGLVGQDFVIWGWIDSQATRRESARHHSSSRRASL